MLIDVHGHMKYNVSVRQGRKSLLKGSEEMEGMSDHALNQYLENIAKLIEANVKDVEAAETAAKIVRDSKVKA